MSKMYRVHCEDDFYSGLYKSWTSNQMGDIEGVHPLPHNDTKLMNDVGEVFGEEYIESYMLFGFSTLEQLCFWIHSQDVRDQLYNEGYIISEIECSCIARGDTQAVFDKRCFTVTEKFTFEDLKGRI